MKKIISDWFTEPDNKTWCLVKALIATGSVTFLVLATFHTINDHALDYVGFGTGFGLLIAGGGGALMMKKDTPK